MNAARRSVSEHLSRGTTPLVSPKGMSDLLPPEAAERRALSRRVLNTFELSGYQLVTPPVFEHAEVVARGNDSVESRDLLRFVEPESGEVAVLRPDITPQIARIVSTRLSHRPAPFRLCYEGRVFRRQRGRARNHRQITQAGLECIGLPGVDGDAEVIELAAAACSAVGLQAFRIELSDIRLVRSLLACVPDSARPAVTDTLARKDTALLETMLTAAGVKRSERVQLAALVECYGGSDTLDTAARRFTSSQAKLALRSLRDLLARLQNAGLDERVVFDLGETRGLAYYTGMHFSLLADGPGEALGGGGRYDNLLSNFEFDAPATGCALDLRNVQWALHAAGRRLVAEDRVRVVLSAPSAKLAQAAASLRHAGIVTATLPDASADDCLAFARAWGYHCVLVVARGTVRVLRTSDGSKHRLDTLDPSRIRTLCCAKV